MAKLVPLHPVLGQPVLGRRPHTAPATITFSSGRKHTGGGFRPTWIHTDRLQPGRQLTMDQVDSLIHGRLIDIKSAFMVLDPDGSGLVTREEFRRVLRRLLTVSPTQLDTVLNQVCESSSELVDYMQFLRRFSRAPPVLRTFSSHSRGRRGQLNTSMSLSEIQKHLKEKIGGNLRTVIRAFSLFDYNRRGHVQQHEFRRILDNYCIQLTDREFQRLWNHYSPNNTSSISYQLFLDQLGFGDSHNFKIAPVCTKLEVSSRGTTPLEEVKQRKRRPESEAPSVLPHRKLQTLFYDKMCMNSTPVWQALQAFDTARSGLVKQDVLRAVLSSFIFPMNPHSFQKLTSCYGVKATGPVRWKHFLGHFMSPVKQEGDTNPHTNRALEQPVPEEDTSGLRDIYSRLTEIFHQLDTNLQAYRRHRCLHQTTAGTELQTDGIQQSTEDVSMVTSAHVSVSIPEELSDPADPSRTSVEEETITRAELRRLLERPGGTRSGPPRSQITELLNVLDPEHSGVIQPASLERLNPPPPSAVNTAEPLDAAEEAEHTADEKQCADKLSLASASWSRADNLQLCEQLSSVLAALELCDPQHTGYITQEDLKKVFSCYGAHISDKHFNKLCETSSSGPASSTKLVHYTGFLRDLAVQLTHETSSSHDNSCRTERPCTSPQSAQQSVRGQRIPSNLQVGSDTRNILDIVFQRMRSRLEQRNSSLTDRIRILSHSCDGTLSEADVRKILEDNWVVLDHNNFHKFTELLGFRDGRIESSVFLVKYDEATSRDSQHKEEAESLLTSAEQCLAAMKTRIKTIHGDNLTAFRLMDRKRKGVVDCHDFKVLYSSLGFFYREAEYQRLLDLIGLHPGGNLNYAEFVDVIENNGKQGTQTASVREQLHELLASEARYKWADMSKVLCQFDTDGQGWIHKKNLRGFLFTYALPMRSDEFDQLWLRYDPEKQGRVAVCDFLEKLGFHHGGELGAQSQKLNQAVSQQNADRSVSSDAASLERMEQILQENYEDLSDSLTHLETRKDGTVTIEELLSLLQTYSCSVQREQLVNHLHRLEVSMDDNCQRLSYMDFLSAFDPKAKKKCEHPPASPDAVHQIESLKGLSPDVALARLRELVTASAPLLYKAFLAFDQSGTGTVKALQFRRVLESFCAHLSDKQHRYMLTKLQLDRENCTVNWKDFLNKFQSQSPLMSERCLSKTRSPIQTKASETTEQIQEVVSGHLYELLDLDPSNRTTISKEQFRQLCDRRYRTLTNEQFECVWSQKQQKKLQYGEFLGRKKEDGATNKVQSPSSEPGDSKPGRPETAGAVLELNKSASQCTSRRPASAGGPGTGSPLGSTARRLRGEVQRCWKEIQRKCTEEDPQREGHISTSSFLEILRSLSINLTWEQFEHLAVKFDIISNGCVSYHNFLRHFLLNLKAAEANKTLRRKLPLPVTLTGQGVLSKDGVEVMLRIHDVVQSSWTSIRRCFLTCDRTRTGSVSVHDFRKVLQHFSITLSSEEFFHLSFYFDANTTGRISYNNFLWAFLH